MNTTFSLVPYQVSRPHTVPAGGIVTVTPAAGATATVEYTKGSHADIINNVASWAPWAKGSVTAVTSDVADQNALVRVTAMGGNVSVSINPNPTAAELAALSPTDWGAPAQSSGQALSADVVVYGATFSGIMAAVSAKKNGASVLLIEPRDDVGGMVTGGIMYTDSRWPTNNLRSTITGLTNKFYAALARYYGYDQQTYYQAQNYSAESKVAQRFLDRLLQEWNIPLYQNAKLTAVSKTGLVINSATFDTLGTVTAKQFIDSTYTGDLMAMAGVSWVVGREAAVRTGANETAVGAGMQMPAANQPTNPVDPYITPGVPASGLLPFVQNVTAPATGAADGNVMAMGYRLCITNNAGNKIPFPAPSNYDPAKYELLRRHVLANGQGWTDINNVFLLQPVLPSNEFPSTKWDINNKGFFSLDYVHPESTEYATASWDRRAQIEANIKEYTLGLLYFLMNDSSVPAAVRSSIAGYGLCADEYTSSGVMPKHPYCREARRMQGDTVILATDIQSLNSFTTPLAQAYYLFDSHPCQYVINASGKAGMEGTMGSGLVAAAGARIPRQIVQPKAAECSNLLVTWCGSMSHAAYSSIRMEPIAGCIGEGAGLIAALAIKRGLPVQSVPSADINRTLNLFGWTDPGALAVSTDGATYTDGSAVLTGFAASNTTLFGTASIASCSLAAGTNTVKLTPSTTKIANGLYDVYLKWSDTVPASGTRASGSTVTITANGVVTTIPIDQTNAGDGGDWYYLGTFRFRKGDAANNNVLITHDNSGNPTNIAGVKFVPAKP